MSRGDQDQLHILAEESVGTYEDRAKVPGLPCLDVTRRITRNPVQNGSYTTTADVHVLWCGVLAIPIIKNERGGGDALGHRWSSSADDNIQGVGSVDEVRSGGGNV